MSNSVMSESDRDCAKEWVGFLRAALEMESGKGTSESKSKYKKQASTEEVF